MASSAVDEAEVHAAHLLDPAVLFRVEPHDLVAALLRRLCLGEQAACIVTAGFRLTGAARCGAAEVFGEPYGHRFHSARKVRARGRSDQEKGDLGRGMDREAHLAGEHEWAEIQAVLRGRWHPLSVD